MPFVYDISVFKTTLFMFIWFGSITGVLCDGYNLAGLVASSTVGALLFIIIVLMIIFGAIWNEWFPKFQDARGKYKTKRIIKSKGSVIGSESKHYPPSTGVSLPPSRQNTEGRRSKISQTKILNTSMQPSEKADTWIQEVRPSPYEEIASEMNFEEEEPDIIVTELLPESSSAKTNGAPFAVTTQIPFTTTNVNSEIQSGETDPNVEKQPLQRLTNLSSNKDAVVDLSDEDDDNVNMPSFSQKKEGEVDMVLY